MATEYDGDIKLGVVLDTKGAEKSLNDLKRTITSALSETAVNGVNKGLIDVNRTLRTTQKEFEKVQSEISKTEDRIRELVTRQNVILERGKVTETKTTTKQYDGKFFSEKDYASIKLLDTQLENVGNRLSELHIKSDNLSSTLSEINMNSDIPNNMETLSEQSNIVNKSIDSVNGKLQEFHSQGVKSTKMITSGFEDVTASVAKLGNRLTNMVKRVFFFSLITKSLRSLRSMLDSVLKSNTQFNTSLKQIQSNLWTAFASIYTKVIPALNAFIDVLAKVTGYVAAFFTALTGNTISDAYNKANELYKKVNEEDIQKQKQKGIDNEIKAIKDKIKALQKENKTIEDNEKNQREANG